ncbi:MAG: DegV family protein [Oscillospiraceae bacterium]|jgi:DegV family protein with EDD domain|nr:DegV family protein [Oscillospiraceae bacterium]
MKIKISADSTCDLPSSLVERHNIGIVPLAIVRDGKPYRDGIEITPEDLFEYVESGKGSCHTTAVNTGEYLGIFSAYLKSYDAVIHINISSQMSSCNQNAVIAAAELDNVYVIDSKNLSTGMGNIVLDAAELAAQGLEPTAIVAELEARVSRVQASFVIDTLKYLHKGGRCSAVAMLGANLLKLKPCIEVIDGKMDVGKKYRGSIDKMIPQYAVEKFEEGDIDPRRLFITYTRGVPQETIDEVIASAQRIVGFDEVFTSVAGCAISNHCGPGTLGVLYYKKELTT